MTLTDYELKYPAIAFFPEYVAPFVDATSLGTTTMLGIKRRIMVGVDVIDAGMNCYRIIDVRKERGIGRFRGYNLFFNQNVKASLTLEAIERELDLSEVRSRVIASVKRNRRWYASGGDVNTLIAEIARAESFRALVGRLS